MMKKMKGSLTECEQERIPSLDSKNSSLYVSIFNLSSCVIDKLISNVKRTGLGEM